jgi:hypothetical protein
MKRICTDLDEWGNLFLPVHVFFCPIAGLPVHPELLAHLISSTMGAVFITL